MRSSAIKATLSLASLALLGWLVGAAVAQEPAPTPRAKAKGQQADTMQNPDDPQGGGPDLAGLYAELRSLAQQFREARQQGNKEHIQVRAEEIMGKIFDAKVQSDMRRIEITERRLNTEKELLHEKQLHKQDLVHQGVQRFFETGEPPEWATSREE